MGFVGSFPTLGGKVVDGEGVLRVSSVPGLGAMGQTSSNSPAFEFLSFTVCACAIYFSFWWW